MTEILEKLIATRSKIQEDSEHRDWVIMIHPEKWAKVSEEERAMIRDAGLTVESPHPSQLEALAGILCMAFPSDEFWDPNNVYFVPRSSMGILEIQNENDTRH